jgi:glycerol kinase
MTQDLLLAIDQGTTSTRAIAFDRRLRPVASCGIPLASAHPAPGWVEQDPEAIVDSVVMSVARVLEEVGGPERIVATGLANQGETVVAWDAEDLRALAPAIGWQCRRSITIVERLRAAALEPDIRERSGLPLDPYYSAGKLAWLLEHNDKVRSASAHRTLRFGTVDAWLTAQLDSGDGRTDTSTASRTQLLNLGSLGWDEDLLGWFGIAAGTLPRLVATAGDLGQIAHQRWRGGLALTAMACDQQAALAGHGAFAPGAIKATYGTGAFVLANAGTYRDAAPDLETSIAWTLAGDSGVGETTATVLQGGVFSAGAMIDWLAGGIGLITNASATAGMASSVADAAGVKVLPALAGLGAPWWRPEAHAVVAGLTAAARPAHVVRATLDGIAHRVADVVEAMAGVLPGTPLRLRVDGGMTANSYLMQRQADLLGIPVDVASVEESTALGIAGLAGLGSGDLDVAAIGAANPSRATYHAALAESERRGEREAWRSFVAGASAL